ncbi:hypothetical protein ACFFUU_06435, partial [Flavobacterium paronense]
MKKIYSIKNCVLVSFLLLLTINVSLLAQSKTGKGAQNTNFSKRVTSKNIARNSNSTRSVLATDVITACNSYTWPVNGLTYNISGIYTDGGGITQLFNDQTAWDTSAATYGATVAFNSLSGIPAATTITLTIGSTSVTLSAPSGMYSSGTFVGVNNPGETITMTFSPSIYGVAGNYFLTNIADNVVNGNVKATYSDGAIDDRTVTTDTETFGYFSTTPLTSVVLTTTDTNRYISLKNISIATNPASANTLDLTINQAVTPAFTAIDPICDGDTLAPLPTTSNNGIIGVWTPALDNTTTTTYTFTPDTGQCATVLTKTITVNPIVSSSTNVTACNSYTWPVTGTTYTTSGSYSTYVTIPDSQVIDDLALWNEHAASYNATVISNTLSGINATNPTNITYGPVTVSMSAPGGMYSSGDFLGTGNANNPLTITFNPPVYGVSGNYFTSDFTDAVISGNITVNYSNGTVQSRTVTTDTDSFGYFDSNYISSIVISSTTTVPNHYVSIKNLSIAANPSTCSTETLNLTINTLPPPGNTLATAIDVTATNYTTTGNNLAINCYTDTVGDTSPDVWYKVALSPCALTLSTNTCTNSDFDTILRIFKEDGTTEIGFSDDDCGSTFQSSISDVDVSAEDIVYVLVEGYVGLNRDQGNYGLEILQTLATQVTPTFTAVADICNGDTLLALPTTSNNGIPGTWSPALDNTDTTTYFFTPDASQCATTTSLTIVVNPLTTNGSVTTSICDGDSYTWPANGVTYTTAQSGVTVVNGCNTATLNLSITPLTTIGSVTTSICDGDSYTWPANGVTYTTAQSGVTVVNGCNTATLNLSITPLTTIGSVTTSICDGDSYTWPANGVTYTTAQSGVTVITGCNTATLNLSITPLTTNGSVTTAICDGDSYTWPANGVTYTTAQTVTVVTGCNTATLN